MALGTTSHRLNAEVRAAGRRWSAQDRWLRRVATAIWVLFATAVFAGTAHETGQLSGPAMLVPAVAIKASHTGGPSIVADRIHSKSEGNCR